jgi:hypothetical protein
MHLANARKRLGAQTREEAVAKAIGLGLIDPQRRDSPQVPVYLSVTSGCCQPGETCSPPEPRRLDVEQRIVDGKLEFEVPEVGFRFVLSDPSEIKAILIRRRGTEVSVQPFFRNVDRNLRELGYHISSDRGSCECWGAGCACFPIEKDAKAKTTT